MDPRFVQVGIAKTLAALGVVTAIFAIALGGRWRPWLLLLATVVLAIYVYLHALPPPR